jgi:hypothetical protein
MFAVVAGGGQRTWEIRLTLRGRAASTRQPLRWNALWLVFARHAFFDPAIALDEMDAEFHHRRTVLAMGSLLSDFAVRHGKRIAGYGRQDECRRQGKGSGSD